MKHLIASLRSYFFFTLLLGLLYPLLVTGLGQAAFPKEAKGSLIQKDGQAVGSKLIAQDFVNEKYFWPRPSAINFNPLPSGGSNLGPTSAALKNAVSARELKIGVGAPRSLLFASGSGLDPDLDTDAALFQIPRIAKVRGVSEDLLRNIVLRHVEKRQLGFLGEERINVLILNLALDEIR